MENLAKIIRGESATGYVLVDGLETKKIERVDLYKGRNVLKLPENSSNRKYQDREKLEKVLEENGEMILEYKETRTLTQSGNRRKLIDYLNDEDKDIFLKLLEKAKKSKDEAMRPKTELEKLQAKIEAEKNKIKMYEDLIKKYTE